MVARGRLCVGRKKRVQLAHLTGRSPVGHTLRPDNRVGRDAHRRKLLQRVGASLLIIANDIVLLHRRLISLYTTKVALSELLANS